MSTAFASATTSDGASHAQFPFAPNVVSIRNRRQMRRLPGTRETEPDHTLTFEERPADRDLGRQGHGGQAKS